MGRALSGTATAIRWTFDASTVTGFFEPKRRGKKDMAGWFQRTD
jgi:hypothetical protein